MTGAITLLMRLQALSRRGRNEPGARRQRRAGLGPRERTPNLASGRKQTADTPGARNKGFQVCSIDFWLLKDLGIPRRFRSCFRVQKSHKPLKTDLENIVEHIASLEISQFPPRKNGPSPASDVNLMCPSTVPKYSRITATRSSLKNGFLLEEKRALLPKCKRNFS